MLDCAIPALVYQEPDCSVPSTCFSVKMSAEDEEVMRTEEFEETDEPNEATGHDEAQDEKQDEETQEGEIDKRNQELPQDDDLDSATTSGRREATASEGGMKTQHPAEKV